VLLTLLVGYPPISQQVSVAEANQMTLDAVPRRLAESLVADSRYGKTAALIAKMLPRTLNYRYATALEAWKDFYAHVSALEAAEEAAKAVTAQNGLFGLCARAALQAMSSATK
jgi:hypothetical protein